MCNKNIEVNAAADLPLFPISEAGHSITDTHLTWVHSYKWYKQWANSYYTNNNIYIYLFISVFICVYQPYLSLHSCTDGPSF